MKISQAMDIGATIAVTRIQRFDTKVVMEASSPPKSCFRELLLPLRGTGNDHRPADGVQGLGDLRTEVVLVETRLAGLHDDQSIIGLDVDHGPPVVSQDAERGASALLLVEPPGAFDPLAVGPD